MADAIKIKVGSSLDSSVEKSFSTIENRAARAQQNIARANQRGGQQAGTSAAAETRARDRELAKQQSAAERAATAKTKAEDREIAKRDRAADAATARAIKRGEREAKAEEASVARAAAAKIRAITAAAKAEDRASARTTMRFASAMGYTTQRTLVPYRPLASLALRTGGEIARGAGVDLSPGSAVARNVALQTAATNLSNQAYIEGQPGQAGIRQDPNALKAEARGVAGKLGLNAADVTEGLAKFTAVSGDLQTGRAVLMDMGKLAAITGANMGDVVDASGQVNAILKDTPDKAARIIDVMKSMTAQGQLGAVELKEQAVQMAKIAATGGRIEGDPGTNIKRLGALMQLARQRGGATRGAQAATSIARLADVLVTPARAKAFEKEGIKTTTKDGKIRDLPSVIFEILDKLGKNPIKMRKVLASSIGSRPAEAMANIYRDAGGGKEGVGAAKEAFEKMASATISEKAETDSLAAHLGTTAAKVAIFQNSLDKTVDDIQAQLLPAFEKFQPAILATAKGLGDLAVWAASNPGEAILAGIMASIAQAGIGTAIRIGIERVVENSAGGIKGGKPGAGPGAIGNISAALTIASLAITTVEIGKAIIDHFFSGKEEEQKKRIGGDIENQNTLNQAKALARAGKTEEAKALVQKFMGANQEGMAAAPHGESTMMDRAGQAAGAITDEFINFGRKDNENAAIAAADARHKSEIKYLDGMQKAQEEATRLLQALVTQGGLPQPAGGVTVYSPPSRVAQ